MPDGIDAADAIVVGAGLAGLVATAELADAGRRVLLVDQEPEASLGGQAFWSLGGLMLVDSQEQRRLRIRDSHALAWQDWLGTAGFDRPEDEWPRRWAEAYVDFTAGEKRAWLHAQGVRFMPNVAWAERGGYLATGHGNSVPRFHLTWGTGPGVLEPFERRVREAQARGRVELRCRHKVDALTLSGGAVTGVRGELLEPSDVRRGAEELAHGRRRVRARSAGRDRHRGRNRRQPRARARQLAAAARRPAEGHDLGCPRPRRRADARDHAGGGRQRDQSGPDVALHRGRPQLGPDLDAATGSASSPDRHRCGSTRAGRRLPPPLFPGFDTLGTLAHIMATGYDHTWFLLNQRIIEKEFALSGSEQNPDITGRDLRRVLASRLGSGAPPPVEAFKRHGADFVVERDLGALVRGMNALTAEPLIDHDALEREIVARDRDVANPYGKDLQLAAIHTARRFLADRVSRIASPHRILDPAAGPLIAVRLSILTRKTLGGLQTDLSARVLTVAGEPLPGLYAAGEVAGFGGGGMHGYRALEGTFLGGCLFSGRTAGRAAAAALA